MDRCLGPWLTRVIRTVSLSPPLLLILLYAPLLELFEQLSPAKVSNEFCQYEIQCPEECHIVPGDKGAASFIAECLDHFFDPFILLNVESDNQGFLRLPFPMGILVTRLFCWGRRVDGRGGQAARVRGNFTQMLHDRDASR